MSRITKIAIKTPTGKIKTAPVGKTHADIGVKGEHGFIAYVGRKDGAKIAKKSGQTTTKAKLLHSTMLKGK